MQGISHRALTIQVNTVKVAIQEDDRATRSDITVQARVKVVRRSASHLRPGASVNVSYSRITHMQLRKDLLASGGGYRRRFLAPNLHSLSHASIALIKVTR